MVDNLLIELKGRLIITWDDEATNQELERIIKRSQKYFIELCQEEFTFKEDSAERELLLERCRYIWNNALEDFEVNFSKELGRLILDTAVKQYVGDRDGAGTV